jgi:restriction system protein
MARRRNQSTAEDLMDLTARAPWWVGVVLAVVSYVALHAYARQPMPSALQPGQLGSFAVAGMGRALANAGQYALPLIFLAGAAISAFRRRRAGQLHASAALRADTVAQMSWHEFELLVGEFFRRQGFSAVNNFDAGPDGGVDVLLTKGTDRYLVQCKHWRALRVGVQPVRELYGVMAAQRAAGGFVVTSGAFTEEARSFAAGREIQLIDGAALRRGVRTQATAASTPLPPAPTIKPPASPGAPPTPECPLCRAPMVMREARTGPLAGTRFWGCSQFARTRCRGTRPAS